MSTQAATFTLANTATLRQTLREVSHKLAQSANPDIAPGAVTITTDTAGSITFAVAACQNNPAYSRVITASVS